MAKSIKTPIQSHNRKQTPDNPSGALPATINKNCVPTIEDRFRDELFNEQKKYIPKLLKNHGIDTDQFLHVVFNEVVKNDKLIKSFVENPGSVFATVLFAAEIGLIPNETIGDFFLIPRNIQFGSQYKMTCTPLIGYKGLVNILTRDEKIVKVHAEVVYEGDEFLPMMGLEPKIIHTPNYDAPRTQDKITHSYAVAKTNRGEYQFDVLTRNQIDTINKTSKYPNSLYFNDKLGINRWMEKKCALFQLAKMIPKDYYSKKAIAIDGAVMAGAAIISEPGAKSIDDVKLVEDTTSVKPQKFRDIYGNLNGLKEDYIP